MFKGVMEIWMTMNFVQGVHAMIHHPTVCCILNSSETDGSRDFLNYTEIFPLVLIFRQTQTDADAGRRRQTQTDADRRRQTQTDADAGRRRRRQTQTQADADAEADADADARHSLVSLGLVGG